MDSKVEDIHSKVNQYNYVCKKNIYVKLDLFEILR